MKKIMLFILTLFLFSCEKDSEIITDPTYCWHCSITTYYKTTGVIPSNEKSTFNKCGWTEKEMNFYKLIMSDTTKIVINASYGVATVYSIYDCQKQ